MRKVFPLAAVVRLRQQKETAAERSLAEADAALRAAALRLRQLEQMLEAHSRGRLAEVGLVLSAAHHLSESGYRAALLAQQVSQQRCLLDLASKRQIAQDHFLHTRSERETVENLEASWEAVRSQETEKQEQRRLDDLSGRRSREQAAAARIAGQDMQP